MDAGAGGLRDVGERAGHATAGGVAENVNVLARVEDRFDEAIQRRAVAGDLAFKLQALGHHAGAGGVDENAVGLSAIDDLRVAGEELHAGYTRPLMPTAGSCVSLDCTWKMRSASCARNFSRSRQPLIGIEPTPRHLQSHGPARASRQRCASGWL